MPKVKTPKIRWSGSMCILDGTIVGTVDEDAFGRTLWFAYGCDVDWQDVWLGSHKTEAAARRAVREWVEERL